MSTPRIIGNRFQIDDLERDLLGRGGMGDVYRGRDTRTGEMVAIKALRPEVVAGDPEVVARFTREGEALRQLDHPNIVRMVEAIETDGRHYLVMEYVPGGSLRDLLEREGRLSIQRTVEVALEVADALTRAHHLGIVHRDLKPSNVLLAEDGTPRLTDFGIARLAASPRLTRTGTVLGTVLYLSPEACRGETLDARTDIWSFGAMLYEMLSGQVPFEGETFPAVVMAILTQPLPDLSQVRPEASDALADLVYRMLEKDRAARIPSVRLVGAELEAILAEIKPPTIGHPPPALPMDRVGPRPPPPTTSRFATPTPPAEGPKHNLPVQRTPFVGREAELVELDRLLVDPDLRLVTVLGAGGMGKTRLALQSAERQLERFADGVYWVSLAPLRSIDAIVPTIAEAMGFSFYGGGAPGQQLLDYLRGKTMLLLLDNYEHLLAGVRIVAEILDKAPRVRLLVTSRVRLNVRGEQLYHLAGMDFPDWERPEDALEYSAVKLFLQSARRVRPGYELEADDLKYISRICRLVGGMPLGILLAAAWVEMLTPGEIAAEIGRSLDFLETDLRDVPERQRSILAVFNSMWAMLRENEREAFARLSVFRGGFTREGARAVGGGDLRTLMSLLNKSLLQRGPTGRYEVHELLRQYAQGKLGQDPAERERVLDLHCAYYAEFLHRREEEVRKGYRQEALLEMDNIRAAWRRATLHRKLAEIHKGLRGLIGLVTGREGESAFADAVDALRAGEANSERDVALAVALVAQGFFSTYLGHAEKGQELTQEGLSILRRSGDQRQLAFGYGVAVAAGTAQDLSEARQILEKSLPIFRELDDYPGMQRVLWLLGRIACQQGVYQEAEQYCREALELSRRNDDRVDAALALAFLGHTLSAREEYARARRCYEESLELLKEIGVQLFIGRLHSHLGDVALAMSDYEEAMEHHRKALACYQDAGVYWKKEVRNIGASWGVPVSLQVLGDIALAMGNDSEAEQHYRRALAMAIDRPYIELRLHLLLGPTRWLAQQGKVEGAVELAALTLHHPASAAETKSRMQELLAELQGQLEPALFAVAQERGRARDLEATVMELLAELGE